MTDSSESPIEDRAQVFELSNKYHDPHSPLQRTLENKGKKQSEKKKKLKKKEKKREKQIPSVRCALGTASASLVAALKAEKYLLYSAY